MEEICLDEQTGLRASTRASIALSAVSPAISSLLDHKLLIHLVCPRSDLGSSVVAAMLHVSTLTVSSKSVPEVLN